MSKLKSNLIYSTIYQILLIIIPLLTVPYVSRVLGAEGVGIYSFTYSIVCYFMHLGILGIGNYGNRKIAKIRNNKEMLSKNFLSIYFVQLVMSMISILIYILYILFICKDYLFVSIIQIIYIFSTMFDINWFFYGLEEFKLTVIRSTILKILSLLAIFIFVKNSNDLWIYTLILAGSTLVSQLMLWPFLIKKINIVKIDFYLVKKHLIPILILFVPYIATSIYKLMDKVMLGYLVNTIEVGYYEQAEKIVNIPTGIITALGTVMLPRMSLLVESNNKKEIEYYIDKSINFMMFLAFPLMFGIIAISRDFVPLFLGDEFFKSSILIYYLVPTIIFLSFSNVIRTHYLIPKERDKDFILSLFVGAIVNLVLNFFLIPKYMSIGACIGTIFAELAVMVYQILVVRQELPIKKYLFEIIPYLVKSIIMFIVIYLFKYFELNNMIRISFQIVVGIMLYFLLNIKYIKNFLNFKNVINLLRRSDKSV